MRTPLLILIFLPVFTLNGQNCYRVYEQISKGRAVPSGQEIHTRGEWMTVATQIPNGYILVQHTANTGCLTYQQATELMDLFRLSDAFYRNVCYPWTVWNYNVGQTKVAMPFGENPGAPYAPYDNNCGCCESCMWQADPAGTFAATDCRALTLTSGKGTVIIGKDGHLYGMGGPITLNVPGIPPYTLPAYPHQINMQYGNISGIWVDANGNGVATIVNSWPFVIMKYQNSQGSSLIRGRFTNTTTFDFNILNPATRQIAGKGRMTLNPAGTQLTGSWQDNYGNSASNWVMKRYQPQANTLPPQPSPLPAEDNLSACDKECVKLCKQLGYTTGKFLGVCLAGIPSGTVTKEDCKCQ